MRVVLLTDKESEDEGFMESLEAELRKEVLDLDVASMETETYWDLPLKALEAGRNADLLFVYVRAAVDSTRLDSLLNKLVDVEMQTGTPILKAVRGAEEDEEETKKDNAQTWAAAILDRIFGEDLETKEKEEEGTDSVMPPST